VRIVDQSVKDGICEGGISDHLEPLIDRQLAGHDGRVTTLAVIEDFKQVATLGRCQNGQPPIVEDQQFSAFDHLEDTGMPPVAPGDGQHLEQVWAKAGLPVPSETRLAPFVAALGHKTRARMCPARIAGLLGPGDRKSVLPMAARDGAVSYDHLHHFISDGVLDSTPLPSL